MSTRPRDSSLSASASTALRKNGERDETRLEEEIEPLLPLSLSSRHVAKTWETRRREGEWEYGIRRARRGGPRRGRECIIFIKWELSGAWRVRRARISKSLSITRPTEPHNMAGRNGGERRGMRRCGEISDRWGKGEGEGGIPHLFARPYVRFLASASVRRPDLNDHREGANHRMNDDRDDGRERE